MFYMWCHKCSTETVNVLKSEGQAKVGGTLVCVSGAILMAIFKGPALLGFANTAPEIIPGGQPELSGWMFSSLATLGIDNWHIGVLCLIANCMCMATFLAVQVIDLYIKNCIYFFKWFGFEVWFFFSSNFCIEMKFRLQCWLCILQIYRLQRIHTFLVHFLWWWQLSPSTMSQWTGIWPGPRFWQ